MGDNMNNETLKQLIYDQLYSAQIYKRLCAFVTENDLEVCFKTFEQDCRNGAIYLENIYQYNNTSSFHPIIKQPELSDDFKENILNMTQRQCEMYRELLNLSYLTALKSEEREVINYLAGICLDHSIMLNCLCMK